MLDRPGADRQRFDPALIPQDVQPAGVTGPGATDLALVNGHAAGLERMHAQQHAVRRRFRRRRGCRARVIAHDRPLRSHRTHRLAQRVSADRRARAGGISWPSERGAAACAGAVYRWIPLPSGHVPRPGQLLEAANFQPDLSMYVPRCWQAHDGTWLCTGWAGDFADRGCDSVGVPQVDVVRFGAGEAKGVFW